MRKRKLRELKMLGQSWDSNSGPFNHTPTPGLPKPSSHQPSLDHILDLTLWPDRTCSLRILYTEQEAVRTKAAWSLLCPCPAREPCPFQGPQPLVVWAAAAFCPGNDDLTA